MKRSACMTMKRGNDLKKMEEMNLCSNHRRVKG
jgi:hypothetical protein